MPVTRKRPWAAWAAQCCDSVMKNHVFPSTRLFLGVLLRLAWHFHLGSHSHHRSHPAEMKRERPTSSAKVFQYLKGGTPFILGLGYPGIRMKTGQKRCGFLIFHGKWLLVVAGVSFFVVSCVKTVSHDSERSSPRRMWT